MGRDVHPPGLHESNSKAWTNLQQLASPSPPPPPRRCAIGDWYINDEGRWVYDANAPAPSVEATQIRPSTRRTLDAIHGDADTPRVGDVGDWIDPNAPDPTPDEVVDRSDPNYVDPWFGSR